MSWPTAGLDRVQRLRVLAAGVPGATFREYRVAAPFERAWGGLADLERSVPTFDGQVRRLEVVGRSTLADHPGAGDAEGVHLRARVTVSRWTGPLVLPFEVDLADGWCWMVARPQLYVVGMAAEPDGDGTRLGHLEGIPAPVPRAARPLVAGALRLLGRAHRHHVEGDVRRITALLEGRD